MPGGWSKCHDFSIHRREAGVPGIMWDLSHFYRIYGGACGPGSPISREQMNGDKFYLPGPLDTNPRPRCGLQWLQASASAAESRVQR